MRGPFVGLRGAYIYWPERALYMPERTLSQQVPVLALEDPALLREGAFWHRGPVVTRFTQAMVRNCTCPGLQT